MYNQGECENSALKTKFIWADKNPNTGLNFKLWKEREISLNATCKNCLAECEALGGRFSNLTEKCYTYDILRRLCAEVEVLYSDDYTT